MTFLNRLGTSIPVMMTLTKRGWMAEGTIDVQTLVRLFVRTLVERSTVSDSGGAGLSPLTDQRWTRHVQI